jgi:transaldolase
MKENSFLKWMTENTITRWCNDSALNDDIDNALQNGAVGCTTNPPLTYEALTMMPDFFEAEKRKLQGKMTGDDKVVALIGIVVRQIARKLEPLFLKSNGRYGYVRTQVQPDKKDDADAMLKMGLELSGFAQNIMVKIPGTEAGIYVLEELAALGIPTNPTVCVSISQMRAAAEAYERGVSRAVKNKIKPAPSSSAIVLGRLQDYLSKLNEDRNAGLSFYELECAALAVAKRCCDIFEEQKYKQMIMPAAFRSARQVSQLAGANAVMTIHPKIQAEIMETQLKHCPRIEEAVDEKVIARVSSALPEFDMAFEPDGLSCGQFSTYGAVEMTLDAFDRTGWARLRDL